MTECEKRLLLLQITDSVFPIGAYSHSYGLETYVQKGIITNGEEAKTYIGNYIRYSLVYTELMAIRLVYRMIGEEAYGQIFELEEEMNAARAAMEIRLAGTKLAARFIKTAGGYLPADETGRWQAYAGRPGGRHQYAVAFGVFCGIAGIALNDSMTAFSYSQVSGMVTNCVKIIPLSQTVGQNILFSLQPEMIGACDTAEQAPEKHFLQAAPGFELRGMQHEALYSRIYMS